MKTVLIFLATSALSLPVFANPVCGMKAEFAAQKIAQLNGLRGQNVSTKDSENVFIVNVDQQQDYVIYADAQQGTCRVDQVHFNPPITSAKTSGAECFFRAQLAAQAVAQVNGLRGQTVESPYSSTNEFLVTVDKSENFSVVTSTDGSCLIEQVRMKH